MTTRVKRPWGWYEELAEGAGYKVKRLLVKENARLSLQRHQHRSEHWVIAAGRGSVYCDGIWMDAAVGNTFDIPVQAVHRAFGGPGYSEKVRDDVRFHFRLISSTMHFMVLSL